MADQCKTLRFIIPVRPQGNKLAGAAFAGLLTILLASPGHAFEVSGFHFNDFQYHGMPHTAPTIPSAPPNGPGYTPPPTYQPSPAEVQQQRATAINQQGLEASRRNDHAGALQLYLQALALSTNPQYALIIQHNVAAAYSWLTTEAQDRGDLDQALRYIQLARRYYPDEPNHDWPGWEQSLRDRIRERDEAAAEAERQRREAAAEAERQRQEQVRTLAANAEQQRAEAREQLRAQLAAETERQRAEVKQKVAEAEKQRAEAKQKIAAELAKSPFAKTDRVAPIDVPPPHLDAKAWSKTFPSEKAPAALQLSEQNIERLREAKLASAEWIVDKLKDKAKELGVDVIMEHFQVSDAIDRAAEHMRSRIERYKELYEARAESTADYLTAVFDLSHESVACLGSASSACAKDIAPKLEIVQNKYGREEASHGPSWLLESILSHGAGE